MDVFTHLVLALIAAGFPWLAGALVLAFALRMAGPIDLRLTIGNRSGKRGRPMPDAALKSSGERET
jgi:hypothetical protein